MKSLKIILTIVFLILLYSANAQWAANGNHIYNTNSGYVGIGNNAPATLLYVGKSMTEPAITIRNLGGSGGATYSMVDDASGAWWKFKATNTGGFKIRDNASGLDVFQIEANSAANALYINAAGSVGVGTSTPASSALVDLTSTSRGFLPPVMTQAQLSAINNPANGLMVFNSTEGKMYLYIENVNTWKDIQFGSGTIAAECGDSFVKNHVAGSVAPVSKTVTYGTVTNVPGEPSKCWITQNLGSDHQASAVSDATEASAGWYWQFNRQQGFKHDGSNRTPNTTWITSIVENSDWVSSADPCKLELGDSWRIPTSTEWTNVDAAGGWTDWNGPWNSLLKLHTAGGLWWTNGSLSSRGSEGTYWSSTQGADNYGWFLYFYNTTSYVAMDHKAWAWAMRCIK